MPTIALPILNLIFNLPIPDDLDAKLVGELALTYFPHSGYEAVPGLQSIVSAWINRNPELVKDVRIETLLMLRDKIDATLAELK